MVAVGAVVGLGCFDDGDAVAEAEELALAVLLTEGDLPSGDWEVVDSGLAEMLAAAPDRTGWPEECETADRENWYEGDVLAVRMRSAAVVDSGDGATESPSRTSVMMSALVFESAEELERVLEERVAEAERQYDEDCTDALQARQAVASFESRTEEALYGLPDENAIRSSIVNRSTGEHQTTTESHFFVRGRVVATYMIFERDESAREIDHQALLEAFEARVVGAQE